MVYSATMQKLAAGLLATYQNSIFVNSDNVGDSREKELIEYLVKVMPHKYGFQSGEVFDEFGNNSGQVDVIIYDDLFSPVFTDGTDKILAPVESTYGIISVKSIMGTKELDHAIEGIKRYDILRRPKSEAGVAYIMPDCRLQAGGNLSLTGTIQQNINCIFAFDTTVAFETIKQKIADSNCVDLLVVPGKLYVLGRLRDDLKIRNGEMPIFNELFESKESISKFVILLQAYLSCNRLIGKDLQKQVVSLLGKDILSK